jgi:glycosyltransferase involved in cell wall biosynthesis
MRLLIVDHNAIDELARGIYEMLGQTWPGGVTLLVPERWHNGYSMRHFTGESSGSGLELLSSRMVLPQRTHRMVYRDLPRILSRVSPEILFINAEPENFQTWHAAHLARQRPAMKLVFSSWRNIDHRAVGYPYRLQQLHLRAERSVLQRADHGIAFTPSAGAIYGRYGYSHMTYIPPAVDTRAFVPRDSRAEREKLGLTEFTVGFVGRLIKEKGVDELLQASALCRIPHQLLIAGDGPERGSLQALSRSLGIVPRTIWVGSLPPARIPDIINAMDVLVLPSRTGAFWKEQFGRVLIEAMACRVPVIGSSSGAIPQVIGNAGVIVEEGNHHALAAAVARLYDDRTLREDLAERGSQRVKRRYSLSVVAAAYRSLFGALQVTPRN